MTRFRVIETEYTDELLEYRGTEVATPVLEVDCVSRTVSVDTRFSGDARTFAEERGDLVIFEIPMLRGGTADKLMHEVAEMLFDSEDSDAMDQIEAIIDRYEADLEYYFAGDWFADTNQRLAEALGITAETSDAEILDLAAIEELAAGGRILECQDFLEKIRDALKAE